mmetsp:Transcript_26009/g.32439  ORF Transcript_26009/g.32439 Transcript_26009/m.32439 type:complete len:85 (-) Transcript_26009:1103-1357(-)
MIRYLNKITAQTNKMLVCTYYVVVVCMAATLITGSIVGLKSPGDLIHEICQTSQDEEAIFMLILHILEMVEVQIEFMIITYTMH